MLFRLPCCLFSSLHQLWQRKLTLSSKIQTCFLWYFGMHNLWHKFRFLSLQTLHSIYILLQLWHTELHSSYHLLFNNVSFEPYVLEVNFPFLDSFFTFPFYTCFPFSSADFERCLSTTSWYFPDVIANGLLICLLPLCWGVSSHTLHFMFSEVIIDVIKKYTLARNQTWAPRTPIKHTTNWGTAETWRDLSNMRYTM
jgi:hypothetical protein